MIQRTSGWHPGDRVGIVGLVALSLALTATAALADEVPSSALELGRRDTARFQDGDLEALHAAFDDTMKAGLPIDGLRGFREGLRGQLGDERSVLDESVVEQGGYRTYVRMVTFEKADAPFQILFSYDADDRIAGFYIRPQQREAPTEHLAYETKTPLRLPFEDAWYVYWGGRTIARNYHTAYPDQRFAYDFLILVDGSSHTGDGTENEQYHAFGRTILAPAPGTVVAVANDVEDNPPGVMNPAQALGNHVVLDHGNGEFSFLAHLKQGTVTVAVGDTVAAGQRLGRSGNSGNTSEAHLHYHLQDTPRFNDGRGLPAPFLGYVADGEPVERGEPVRGQVVRPAGAPAAGSE